MKNKNNLHYHIYPFLNLIPKNKLLSYKTLGQIFWLHPRAVAKILSENTETEKHPCYKVIHSNWEIGWYNKWIEEKIKRLEKDWFIIKTIANLENKEKKHIVWHKSYINTINNISSDNLPKESSDIFKYSIFWKPILFNFFVAFPLEEKEVEKFKKLTKTLSQINNWSFTLQKSDTPHITLRFFWELNLKTFHKIISATAKNIKKIKTSLINQIIAFNQLDNFWERVYFYKPKSENIEKEFKKFYIQFHKLIWIPKETRPYRPHLTIARIKNPEKFEEIKQDFIKICENFKFNLKINKLRFYAAVDNQYQIPLIDINLT
jgi:2'-5' RNA ligase/alkylated DNA nucleotide flippase Atl1